MSAKANEVTDPTVLLERIIYRTARLLDRLADKNDPVAFVRLMAGHNRTDLRRLAALLDVPIEHLSSSSTPAKGPIWSAV